MGNNVSSLNPNANAKTSSSSKDSSSAHTFDNIEDALDYIASKYILTSDFQSLRKLSEKEYCEKLVVLTSDIIDRYFNHHEITYLEQRIKNGVEINEKTKKPVYYLSKDQLDHLDIQKDKQKGIKKKRVCIGIAKFYVKIAHLFSAILTTVNPVYLYKDPVTGQNIKKSIYDKHQLPTSAKIKMKWNLCENRINALNLWTIKSPIPSGRRLISHKGNGYQAIEIAEALNKGQTNTKTSENKETEMNIQPDICSRFSNGNSLIDEPGMKELQELYYDKYDYSTGKFVGMTEETAKEYEQDVKTFYTAFTGNKVVPPEIKKFSDIPLASYATSVKGCQGPQAPFKQRYSGSLQAKDKIGKPSLFYLYAKNLQEMMATAENSQKELLAVLFDVFHYVVDPYTGEKKVRINPDLKEELLNQLIVKTRKLIMQMYITCEEDYVKGLHLFEAIVESKILETTQKQVNQLEEKVADLTQK
jgi:hypothetical protein